MLHIFQECCNADGLLLLPRVLSLWSLLLSSFVLWGCLTGVDTVHLHHGWEPISLVKVRDASTCPIIPSREASRSRCAFWGKSKKQLCGLLHPISWLSSTLWRQPTFTPLALALFSCSLDKGRFFLRATRGGPEELKSGSSVPLEDGRHEIGGEIEPG